MRLLSMYLATMVATAAPLYTVREFGVPDALATSALAVSSGGTVVGEATAPDQSRIAVSASGAFATSATAADVNSAGAAVGTVWTDYGPRAAVWENGASQILDIWNSYATGINERGDIVGSGRNGDRTSAFLHAGGVTTFLDIGIAAAAYDVNNNGQVAGYAEQPSGMFRAFLWTPNHGAESLGTLGGRHSYAQAVNDAGAVVGASTNHAGYLNAFLYLNGMVNLGTLGGTTSAAYDINSAGQVVGYSTDQAGRMRAFLWRDGMLFDLTSLIATDTGWVLEAAYGINDHGQIVGAGTKDGRATGFILDPAVLATTLTQPAQFDAVQYDASLEPVPEPATWAMVGGALVLLGGFRRHRHVQRLTPADRE